MKRMLVVVALAGAFMLLWASVLFAQWEPDQRLSNSVSSLKCYNNAQAVTANALRVHVVWKNYQSNQDSIFYKRSTDGGDTWGSARNLSRAGINLGLPPDPAIARSGSGSPESESLYVVWKGGVGNTDSVEIFFTRSTDGGTSWDSVSRLTRDTCYPDQPSIAATGPFVHVASMGDRESPLGTKGAFEILYQRSTNGGATWDQDTCLSKKDNQESQCPSIGVSGDTVHLVWHDNQDSNRTNMTIHYRRSTDAGVTWESEKRLTTYPAVSLHPSIAVEGSMVHVVCMNDTNQGDSDIYDIRSTDGGTTWETPKLVMVISANFLPSPSVAASGSNVYVAYRDCRYVRYDSGEVHMKYSPDNGTTWLSFCRLTTNTAESWYPSVAASDTLVHVVWADSRDHSGWPPPTDIYYKHYRSGSGRFPGHLTIPSQGRHLVRDPCRGNLHMVMQGEDKMIYYTRSSDNGSTWVVPETLGLGLNPSVGLAQLPEDVYPYYYALCVAYSDTNNYQLIYQWNDGYDDPGTEDWHRDTLTPAAYPLGAPALTAFNTRVYVTYAANSYLYCDNFEYNLPDSFQRKTLDNSGSASQPSMAYDGGYDVHAAWKRGDRIYYASRDSTGNWVDTLRADQSSDPSQHPFVECYGDSAYVVWSDYLPSPGPSDIWRVTKYLDTLRWQRRDNVSSSSDSSLSPVQAWSEFVTWAEGRPTQGMFDIKYWRSSGDTGIVEPNPTLWSYWPHAVKWDSWFWGTYLFTAWTESPTPNQPPYTVMTKLPFGGGFGGSGSGFLTGSPEYGIYYQVHAGQDAPSPYCQKRDGVMKFEGKAVDFARDSLVYEFRYLDPKYDYLVKVSSYREEGVNWTQGLSVDGRAVKLVKFASNKVDTAWFKISPAAYAKDHRAAFALKNVKGDYVTNLGLTLYQRDPWRSGKGGPQVGAPVDPVYREVFAVYPNPVTNQAHIEYSLRTEGKVSLSVYDITGRLVRSVVNDRMPAGVHKAVWDGRNGQGKMTASGVYLIKLNSPERAKTTRVVVVR